MTIEWIFPNTDVGFLFLILARALVLHTCDNKTKERLAIGSRIDLDVGPPLSLDGWMGRKL